MCSSLNMEYIEIQTEPPYILSDMTDSDMDHIREVLEKYHMKPTVHGPLDDVNLSSLKEPIRRASVDLYKESIDFAVEVKASILVIHAGVCPVDQLVRLEDARNRFHASLLELASYGKENQIMIGLENKQKGVDREIVLYTKEHIDYIIEYRDYSVGAVLDFGHANTVGSNMSEYIAGFGNQLLEVHLHDNDGLSDSHLSLGQGSLDIACIIQALSDNSFEGPIILELKTEDHLRESVDFLEGIYSRV
ncbi:MAG: sugar phosphate isomerase/epimerase family protein [Candidatus Thorarchaeota archaeon]